MTRSVAYAALALVLALSFAVPFQALAARTSDGDVPHYLVTTTSSPPTGQPFTMVAWAKFTDLVTYWPLVHTDTGGHASYVEVTSDFAAPGKIDLIASDQLGSYISICQTSTTATAGVWCHWAASCASNNDWRVYLNGGGKGTSATAINVSTITRLTVGGFHDGTTIYSMKGAEAGFARWSAALTDDEVTGLAKGQHPYCVRRNSLTFYCSLEGNRSPEIDTIGQRSLTVSAVATKTERRMMRSGGRR